MWRLFILVVFTTTAYSNTVPAKKEAPLIKLNDGNSMPAFGLGTWLGLDKKGALQTVDDDSVVKAVEAAIDAGYRHIDTAQIYNTEPQVGTAVGNKIKEGVVTREEMFITTKLWNDKHARDDVVPSLRSSLAKLNMDYIDLFLIHWPISTEADFFKVNDIGYLETWQGMVEAKRLGLTRSIGVSNFNITQMEDLLNSTDVVPAALQIEVNLNMQQPELRQFCHNHNITVMGYTPFGSIFGAKGSAEAPPPRVDDPQLVGIGKKYGKTVPQVVLRYLFELGVVAIPKTVKKERLTENIDIFDFQLTEEERKILKSFDKGFRSWQLNFWPDSKYFPF